MSEHNKAFKEGMLSSSTMPTSPVTIETPGDFHTDTIPLTSCCAHCGGVNKIQYVVPQASVQTKPQVNYSLTAAPLGLMAFGTTTFMLSLINAQIITAIPNIIVGPALGYGGLIQVLTAMWDIKSGNALSACISGSFGAFWIATAVNYMPMMGVVQSYSTDEFLKANGVIFLCFVIFAIMMLVASLRTSVSAIILMCCVIAELTAMTIGFVQADSDILKIGGYLGLLVGAGAWYNGMVLLLQPELSWYQLPVGKLKW